MPKLSADEKKLEPGSVVTVCLPGIDEIRMTSFSLGGSDAEQAVLGLQHYGHAVGDIVGNQRRQTDAEIDVKPSRNSLAARAAICSRVQAIWVSVRKFVSRQS